MICKLLFKNFPSEKADFNILCLSVQSSVVSMDTVAHFLREPRRFDRPHFGAERIERVLDVESMQLDAKSLDRFVDRSLIANSGIILDRQQKFDLRRCLVAVHAHVLVGEEQTHKHGFIARHTRQPPATAGMRARELLESIQGSVQYKLEPERAFGW